MDARGRVVAVPLKEFAQWGGGIDFIRLMLQGLLHVPGRRVVALIPRPTWTRRARAALKRAAHRLVGGKGRGGPDQRIRPEEVRAAIADFIPRIEARFYPDSRRGLRAALRKVGADVALPCIRPLGSPAPCPWVGYIFDFQHRYLPQLFTEAERAGRDAAFTRMLAEARVVICHSESARRDAERFHPGSAGRIVALPFAPVPRDEWFGLDPAEARLRHRIPQRYFIVCNQFWVHKDHPTAIRAFAAYLARAQAGAEADLVCTGKVDDYRDPAYPATIRALIAELGLEGRVHLLGHIAKNDQIALMRGALAVLQPTWFEGGRGGGAVYDAVALGVPSLMSDLEVNREIEDASCRFFPKGDPEALAALMEEVAAQAPPRPDQAELVRRAQARVATLSQALDQVIAMAGAATAAPLPPPGVR
jgi:glycosyltransferase involved in cell wall biosynthesis